MVANSVAESEAKSPEVLGLLLEGLNLRVWKLGDSDVPREAVSMLHALLMEEFTRVSVRRGQARRSWEASSALAMKAVERELKSAPAREKREREHWGAFVRLCNVSNDLKERLSRLDEVLG